MNNADKPAYPVKVDMEGVPKSSNSYSQLMEVAHDYGNGLTKREKFAMAAMQGIMSSMSPEVSRALGSAGSSDGASHDEVIAEIAVAQADALLKALED